MLALCTTLEGRRGKRKRRREAYDEKTINQKLVETKDEKLL
jgi:hypothetical protein